MTNATPKSRGSVSLVKNEIDSDTLGIGASDLSQLWSEEGTMTDGCPTSALVQAHDSEHQPRDNTYSPYGHSCPVAGAGTTDGTPPVNAQTQRRYLTI
jgi:hypothetical protein